MYFKLVAATSQSVLMFLHPPTPFLLFHFTVTFDMPPDLSTVEQAQPMEAINYFVEMEVEKQMERMRLAAAREKASKEEEHSIAMCTECREFSLTAF